MITAITNVFTGLGDWLIDYLPSIMEIFYDTTANTLTFLGVLAICGLGFSIFLLLMNIVKSFLQFR